MYSGADRIIFLSVKQTNKQKHLNLYKQADKLESVPQSPFAEHLASNVLLLQIIYMKSLCVFTLYLWRFTLKMDSNQWNFWIKRKIHMLFFLIVSNNPLVDLCKFSCLSAIHENDCFPNLCQLSLWPNFWIFANLYIVRSSILM